MDSTKNLIFLILGALSVLVYQDIRYFYHSWDCADNKHHTAYYIVKDNIPYCFIKENRYPHRVRGGILVTKD